MKILILLIVQINLLGLPATIYVSHPSMRSCEDMRLQFASDINVTSVKCEVRQYRTA